MVLALHQLSVPKEEVSGDPRHLLIPSTEVFKAVYIWVSEFPAKQIGKEAGLNKDTTRKLLRDCRQVLEQGTCMLPNPVHVA